MSKKKITSKKQPGMKNKSSSKKTGGIYIAIGIAIVFIIGFIIVKGFSGGTDTKTTSGTASFKDGVYETTSGPDQFGPYHGIYSKIRITVSGGKITDVDWSPDPVDSIEGLDAMRGARKYASRLVETQDVDKVDAITGASMFSHKVFTEIAKKALENAKK